MIQYIILLFICGCYGAFIAYEGYTLDTKKYWIFIVFMILFINLAGCSSIPSSPYDNEPFIWID